VLKVFNIKFKFFRNLEEIIMKHFNYKLMELYWEKVKAVALLGSDNEEKDNNADYNKGFIHYYCCIGGCCSTGTEAEAWRFFWRKLEDVGLLELNFKHGAFFLMGEIYLVCYFCFDLLRYNLAIVTVVLEAVVKLELILDNGDFSGRNSRIVEDVVRGIGGCCSTEAGSKTYKLFFGRNSFRINASYNSETRMWITETESEMCKLVSFERNLFRINASYDKETRNYCCCFGGCCSTGTDSEALRLFWKKVEDVPLLQLNLKYKSFSVLEGIYLELMLVTIKNPGIHLRGIRNCRSAGAVSGAWDDHIWSKQRAVVLLELDLKDGNSPGMKWRLIETVSEARRFSRNRLGAVVLLRPNLDMAAPLEQIGSCVFFLSYTILKALYEDRTKFINLLITSIIKNHL
uniref:Uncharacterized protein n=1 Tax=Strongyloides stercoralis TaxID=6248 RepID=A0AAF5CZR6_STRER